MRNMRRDIHELREGRRNVLRKVNMDLQVQINLIQSIDQQSSESPEIESSIIAAFNSDYRQQSVLEMQSKLITNINYFRNLDSNPARSQDGDDDFSLSDDDEDEDEQSVKLSSSEFVQQTKGLVASVLLNMKPFESTDSATIYRTLVREYCKPWERRSLDQLGGEFGGTAAVDLALNLLATETKGMDLQEFDVNGKKRIMILDLNQKNLSKVISPNLRRQPNPKRGRKSSSGNGKSYMIANPRNPVSASRTKEENEDKQAEAKIEAMCRKTTFLEAKREKEHQMVYDLVHKPTAKELALRERVSRNSDFQSRCEYLTKEDCMLWNRSRFPCQKVHFKKIIASHTDTSLGQCSYLDKCKRRNRCKKVHYEVDCDYDQQRAFPSEPRSGQISASSSQFRFFNPYEGSQKTDPDEPQWINCDIRSFPMLILGKFDIVMADPPWDIRMELPYGTMTDEEMRTLNVECLQEDGLIFLWVTGRARELGRELMESWGYKKVEEIVWVKTNQINGLLRFGRTGHWLNHTKEHCLVGIKGNPVINKNIDTDVLVSEIRETSRKPDEMYSLIERIKPGGRKIELFARSHNTYPGWISLGNQLNGVRLVDQNLRAQHRAAFPDVEIRPPSPKR